MTIRTLQLKAFSFPLWDMVEVSVVMFWSCSGSISSLLALVGLSIRARHRWGPDRVCLTKIRGEMKYGFIPRSQ